MSNVTLTITKSLDREPSTLHLRLSALHSPDRVIAPNSRANSKHLYNTLNAVRIPQSKDHLLVQPGHMEHLLPKDTIHKELPVTINRHGKPLKTSERAIMDAKRAQVEISALLNAI